MLANLNGLLWLLLLLGPLLFLQRGLHREVQMIFLLLTRRTDITLVLFSILFFPGVLLHEGSHFLMARLLGVSTERLSLLPRPLPDGRLQLGFVETVQTDWVRDALIGLAPLLAGGVFVAYAGLAHLGLASVWQAVEARHIESVIEVVPDIYMQPDFWLWFYLTLTVSSTMLPSASDRRAWLPVGLMIVLLLIISLLAGAGPWLVENLSSPLNVVLLAVAIVFGISILVHIVLWLPLWGFRYVLTRLMGLQVISLS